MSICEVRNLSFQGNKHNCSTLPSIGGDTLNSTLNSALTSPKKLAPVQLFASSSGVETVPFRLPASLKTPTTQSQSLHPAQLFDTMKLPITAAKALKNFMGSLTSYEQGEIFEYPQIYFLGLKANKITPDITVHNSTYDDERGDYKLVLADHIAYRFEILQILGRGSFGQVVRCFDHKKNEFVALKIIRNKKRFHRQASIEVRILQHLRDRDLEDSANLVHFKESLTFRMHLVRFTQVIAFELLSYNLYELIKSNDFKGVSLGLIRRFAVQILNALRFLRQQRVIHCDLKPENILLKQAQKSGLKIVDFGSACFESERVYTYIQSRFYRAPEIMLGLPYSVAIDMWSFGCILAELFLGTPLFSGENEVEQMSLIMEVLGVPPRDLLIKGSRAKAFFGTDYGVVQSGRGLAKAPGSKTLVERIACSDVGFVRFLERN